MAVSMKSAVAKGMKPSTVKTAPVAAPSANRMMVWQPVNNK